MMTNVAIENSHINSESIQLQPLVPKVHWSQPCLRFLRVNDLQGKCEALRVMVATGGWWHRLRMYNQFG